MNFIRKKFSNYYKKLIQNIFKVLYGNISSSIKPSKENDIEVKNISIQNINYKIYICNNSRLYTDTIHDTAIIKNNKIIDGPSFQYRLNKNVSCELNSVFTKGTPRFKKKIKGQVLSLLTGGGGNSNYWHWLLDVLPRLEIIKKLDIDDMIDYYLFPSLDKKFQQQTLDIINLPLKKRLSSKNFRHFFADKIFVTSHPYTLLNNPNLDSLNIPIWISNFLRYTFKEKAIEKSKIRSFPEKIYINRKDSTLLNSRYIVNLIEVEAMLENYGFKSLTMSDFNFSDQVALFSNAKQVIGLHGAGFANIIFCKEKCKIIEMKSDTAGDLFKNLAISNNLNYQDICVTPKTIKFNNQAGDIEINLNSLNNLLNHS